MNGRQHIMALCLAAALVVTVVATAMQQANTGTSQVEVPIEPRTYNFSNDTKVTAKAKTPLQRSSSPESQGSIWNRGPAYDLTVTSRASIYVLYTPR